MAADRTSNKTFIAEMLKADQDDQKIRELVNGIMKVINKSGAEVQAASIATLVTALNSGGF